MEDVKSMDEPFQSARAYYAAAMELLVRTTEDELGAVQRAGALIAERLAGGGTLHTFGTGHSRIPALELSARAGGLAPVGMIAIKDLVFFGGEPPEVILDPTRERDPELGRRVFELAPIAAGDVVLAISNSGANAAVVEFALAVRELGVPLIVITSAGHTAAVDSGHASGLKLRDLAEIVIDNHAPVGDALLVLPDGRRTGGASSLTGVLLCQMIQAEIVGALQRAGREIPVLTSQNLPNGDAANADLLSSVRSHVRPIEP